MKKLLLLFVFGFSFGTITAQQKIITVFVGPAIALGSFSATHGPGIGVEASAARRTKKMGIALTYHSGATYFFGKEESTSGYEYKYAPYTFIHALAGALYKPVEKVTLRLTAGPGVAMYRGNARFSIGTSAGASYIFNERWNINPSLWIMKEMKSEALYAGSFKLGYTF